MYSVVMAIASGLTLTAWLSTSAAAAGRQPGSTLEGVYTEAQAASGQVLFRQTCESCHAPSQFKSPDFARVYGGKPLSRLDLAMAEMPENNPGTLTEQNVGALIAYILQLNGYPAGSEPLSGSPDDLKFIVMSPQP